MRRSGQPRRSPGKRLRRRRSPRRTSETLKLVLTFGGSIGTKLEHMAKQLWCSDLAPLILEEQRKLAEIGLISKSVELKASAPPSSYTARGLTGGARGAR